MREYYANILPSEEGAFSVTDQSFWTTFNVYEEPFCWQVCISLESGSYTVKKNLSKTMKKNWQQISAKKQVNYCNVKNNSKYHYNKNVFEQ